MATNQSASSATISNTQDLIATIKELNDAISKLDNQEEADTLRQELAAVMGNEELEKEAPDTKREAAVRASENILGPNPMIGLSGRDFLSVGADVAMNSITHPLKTLNHVAKLGKELVHIAKGKSDVCPEKGDRRFADSAWSGNPVYKRVMQAYLAWAKQIHECSEDLMEDENDKKRARFMMSLLTDTLSPTNSLANPAALKRVLETGGVSLLAGVRQMADDFRNNGGLPLQVDTTAFEVGKNLATTPGSVVFRNELLELIQYTPTTVKVHQRPLLFIPPQINKYYVLDLSPEKSLMKYLVDNGFQYFVVSWRNPTARHRESGLDEYVQALIEAIDVMREIASSDDINVMGACSGGISSVVTLAHLAATEQKKVHSLTLLVCMLDTVTDTEMALFSTEASAEIAKQRSHKKGYVDSRDMARAFAWLRPNDLIWNYWVNNYLLGNPPPAFDILYWNNDATRLTGALHGDFIDIFTRNSLVNSNSLEVLGTPIDLSSITCEYYCVAGSSDHITPWKTCYQSHKLLGGKGTFVLSNSGHIQSLVNPPSNPKASYFANNDLNLDADAWLESATQQKGTWWLHWKEWLTQKSGPQKAAPKSQGSEKHQILMAAPGQYIFE